MRTAPPLLCSLSLRSRLPRWSLLALLLVAPAAALAADAPGPDPGPSGPPTAAPAGSGGATTSPDPGAAPPTTAGAPGNARTARGRPTARDRSPDEFVPSEEVSEDLSVSFPVDI